MEMDQHSMDMGDDDGGHGPGDPGQGGGDPGQGGDPSAGDHTDDPHIWLDPDGDGLFILQTDNNVFWVDGDAEFDMGDDAQSMREDFESVLAAQGYEQGTIEDFEALQPDAGDLPGPDQSDQPDQQGQQGGMA